MGDPAGTGSDPGGRNDTVELVIVAAVAENGVIGAGGDLPWHYPEDLAHFKETTMGHPVVVGRNTYESIVDRIGEPLPGRTNVVLTSRDLDLPDGAVRAGSVAEAMERARATGSEVAYVVGGASVYRQFLPRADRMVITEIPESPEGDTYFPEYDRTEWVERDREERGDLALVEYERR
ncbi:dihydrofolate reductase [Halobacteriales archaeon QS_8_69_26]|nr:MAG: dihydrofolate reductase [Halobacteriales archaeon QS_8_69_26]